MTVEAIKSAIADLSPEERASLVAWLHEQEYDEWDQQMVDDFSPGGRGYHVAEKVMHQISERKFTSLETGMRARRSRR
jgi:hypothetical protein